MRPVTLPSGSRADLDKVSFISANYYAIVDGVSITFGEQDHATLVAAWDQRYADYARLDPFLREEEAPDDDPEESFL